MTTPSVMASGLTSFTLRNLAMLFMFIDHMGSSLFPDHLWLRYIGRLAFPIFAFLIVEGFYHTKNLNHYMLRLLGIAIVTDIPFQYLVKGNLDYVPFQNVLWTFVISLMALTIIDWLRQQQKLLIWLPLSLVVTALAAYLAYLLKTDYDLLGVLTITAFYFFRGKTKGQMVLLLISLAIIHFPIATVHSFFKAVPADFQLDQLQLYINYYGFQLISPQYYALFSLPLIWAYNGQPGHKSKASQIVSYLFYPLHMLLLGWLKPPL